MNRSYFLMALSIVCCVVPSGRAVGEESRVGVEVGIGGTYVDNFFQAPDDAEKENVSGLTAEVEVVGRLSRQKPLLAYGGARVVDFNKDLPTASEFNLGFRVDGARHWLDAYWRHDNNRPSITVGDEFDVLDGDTLAVDYAYRLTENWQIGAEGAVAQEDYALSPQKESDLWRAGAAIRYRGFGSIFSPEIGWLTGARDVLDPNESYDQTDYFVKFRSVPIRPLYLSLRIRFRDREYSISDPTESNFGRQDDRTQFALNGTYAIGEHWALNLYATWVDADSTKQSRIFTSSLASLWLSYSF